MTLSSQFRQEKQRFKYRALGSVIEEIGFWQKKVRKYDNSKVSVKLYKTSTKITFDYRTCKGVIS